MDPTVFGPYYGTPPEVAAVRDEQRRTGRRAAIFRDRVLAGVVYTPQGLPVRSIPGTVRRGKSAQVRSTP